MSACARLWQVEAARDGRLTGKDLASAERHRATCAECSAEERALGELGQRIANMRAIVPEPLSVRRARQRLLGSWNDHLLRGTTPSRRVGVLLALAATLIVGASAVLLTRPKPAPQTESSLVQVAAGPEARWTERRAAGEDRIVLAQGFASFSVSRHDRERVFIEVPDGEIEDLGTVFEVRVRDLRTTHVYVREGRVFVRLRTRAPFELKAGQSWESEPSEVAAVPAAPSAVVPRGPAPLAAPPKVAASVKAKPAFESAASPSSTKPEPTLARSDSAEDDAYLHIVDLLRNGHGAEARAQAERYLVRFPSGFRRPEVQSILARQSSTPSE